MGHPSKGDYSTGSNDRFWRKADIGLVGDE